MSFAENWKALGTLAYKEGDYNKALEHYSQAIELDPKNAVYFVNRSLTYAALNQWNAATKDAREAVILDKKYLKAHFRLVKGLVELRQFREARLALNYSLNECGEQKELKTLEQELFAITLIPVRPKSTDFEIIKELGRGNFTQIFKTYYKPTKQIFAVKTIEKQTIDRMKKRHPNINNEILMEKRTLNKLSHPGIEILFNTFQDYGTLYYQLEYLPGHDLWYHLHELLPVETGVLKGDSNSPTRSFAALPYFSYNQQGLAQPDDDDEYWEELNNNDQTKKKKKNYFSSSYENEQNEDDNNANDNNTHNHTVPERQLGTQLGLPWDISIFYLQELLVVLEYLHQHGIVHRDLKPENILIHARTGHLKLIDFGTAKDLIQTDLNGPEFVGTPEYMSPNTVSSAKHSTIESDLWAVGVIAYQMWLGRTPYAAASPYLTFLKIKRNFLLLPSWLPSQCTNFLATLLIKDPLQRLTNCTNLTFTTTIATPSSTSDTTVETSVNKPWYEQVIEQLPSLSYDKLRGLPLFAPSFRQTIQSTSYYTTSFPSTTPSPSSLSSIESELPSSQDIQAMKTLYTMSTDSTKNSSIVPIRIPSLHELCLHTLTETCIHVGQLISTAGGIRPTNIPWLTSFNLNRLSPLDQGRIFHQLVLKKKAQLPTIARLFTTSIVDMKCLKSRIDRKDCIGFTHALQGHALHGHHAAIVSTTCYEYTTTTTATNPAAVNSDLPPPPPPPVIIVQEEDILKQTISMLNKLRPKFVLFFGPFLPITLPSLPHTLLVADNTEEQAREKLVVQATERFRRLVARVSDTIGVFFIPSPHDLMHYSSTVTGSDKKQALHTTLLHPVSSYLTTTGVATTTATGAPKITYAGLLQYRGYFGADYYAFWYEGSRYVVLNSSLFFVSSPSNNEEEDEVRLYNERLIQECWLEDELEQGKLCSTNMILCSYHPWYFQDVEEEDMVWYAGETSPTADRSEQRVVVTQNIPLIVRQKYVKKLQHHKIKYHFTASLPLPLPSNDTTTATTAACSIPRPFAKQNRKKKATVAEEGKEKEEVQEQTKEEETEEKKNDDANDGDQEKEEKKKEEDEDKQDNNSESEDESDFENLEEDYEGPQILFTPSLFSNNNHNDNDNDNKEKTSVRFVYFEENKHSQCLISSKAQLPNSMDALVTTLQSIPSSY